MAGIMDTHQRHASLEERMNYVEKELGDSADKHARAMSDLKKKHEDLRSAHGQHANVPERLRFLEQQIGDSADKHARHIAEIEALRKSHDKHAKEMGSLKDQHKEFHASLTERVAYI